MGMLLVAEFWALMVREVKRKGIMYVDQIANSTTCQLTIEQQTWQSVCNEKGLYQAHNFRAIGICMQPYACIKMVLIEDCLDSCRFASLSNIRGDRSLKDIGNLRHSVCNACLFWTFTTKIWYALTNLMMRTSSAMH